jgi:capsid protein
VTRLENGLSTLEYEAAENGFDLEELIEQMAREQELARRHNVQLPWMAAAQQPEAAPRIGAEQARDITPDQIEQALQELRVNG